MTPTNNYVTMICLFLFFSCVVSQGKSNTYFYPNAAVASANAQVHIKPTKIKVKTHTNHCIHSVLKLEKT